MSAGRCPNAACSDPGPHEGSFCELCGARLDAEPAVPEDLPAVEPLPSRVPEAVPPPVRLPELAAGIAGPRSEVQLAMDTGVRPRIGAAGNLWFGLVNPGEHEVDCHLVVEVPAEHRECFPRSHGRWTKWVRVAPRKSASRTLV